MLIVSTITPSEEIQQHIEQAFPNVTFKYEEVWNDKSLAEAEVLITYGEDLTDEHIEKAKKLKWIMVMSAGLEKMPFKSIEERGILVTNARGIHKIPMAEYTFGMMLQYEKRLKQLIQQERDENWQRSIVMGELHGKSMLILGTGAIGGEIARLAKAFGMTTLGINRSGQGVEHIDTLYKLEELLAVLPQADYIVSVLPSTKATRYILTEKHFQAMKSSAVFINIGRGDLVKESVLLQALEKQEITHAILDVFESEPLPRNHPYWNMKNVTVTPHVSSQSDQYLPRCFVIFGKNLQEYVSNGKKYINVIDINRGY
ncbi:D-2-hydroxyacid dehydrogenase [Bacillus sp. JJ634]